MYEGPAVTCPRSWSSNQDGIIIMNGSFLKMHVFARVCDLVTSGVAAGEDETFGAFVPVRRMHSLAQASGPEELLSCPSG